MELWGNLRDFSLPDVIQLVGFGRKTGMLSVEYNDAGCQLFFEQGNVVHAQMGATEGEQAVYDLFRLEDGEFRFQADVEAPRQTIFMAPTNLVMEAARLLDESSRQEPEKEPVEEAAAEPSAARAAPGPPVEPAVQEPLGEISFEVPVVEQDTTQAARPTPAPEQIEVANTAIYTEPPDELAFEVPVVEQGTLPELPDEISFEDELQAPKETGAAEYLSPGEVRGEIKALLEDQFGRDAKRLLQAVEKCGDTSEDFQQLATRVERFVSAFVDPASAAKVGEKLREIIDRLSGSS